MWPLVHLVAGLLLALLVGCGNRPANPDTGPQVFVGEIAGSDALIALVVQDGNLVAYACGGPNSWGSHTGWFYGSVGAGQINPTTAPNGHRLEGRLDGQTASGSFTLPDGNTLRWSAERARPGSGAGLYSHEQDGQLTGLIVTNTGKMAGASRLATGDSTGLYAPVQVTTPPTSTNPSPGVSVNFPNLPPRDLNLTPVDLLRHMVVPDGPTLIVLLHGATARTPTDNPSEDGVPGTRKHARHYWTYPFVKGLLGAVADKDIPLVTLEGTDITGKNFLDVGLTLPGQGEDQVPASDQCTLGDLMTAERFSPGQAAAPRLTVLLGHRDAKDSLVEQAMYAVDQIYACVTLFEQTFKRKPKLVFVAHSWGGLITRFILSNPTRASLQAITNPLSLRFPASNSRYDTGDLSTRVKMDYLRNLTYYAITMATPHQGVRFMDRATEVIRAVGVLRGTIDAADQAQERLLNAWRNAMSLLVNLPPLDAVNAEPVVAALASFEQFAQTTILGTNRVWGESHTGLWAALNTGPLHPSRAIRTNHSPIVGAKNQLIPIYALGARNPGSTVADTLNLVQIPGDYIALGSLQKGGTKRSWVLQAIGGDFIYRFLDLSTGPRTPFAGFASQLDRTERVDALALLRTYLDSVAPQLNLFFRAQFGSDTSSLLRFVLGQLKVQSTSAVPIFLNQGFRVDLGGSVQLPVPRLSCSGVNITLDYGPLVLALVAHYGSLQQAASALASLSFPALLSALNSLGGDFVGLAVNLSSWMAQTLTTLANLPSGCAIPASWTLSWPLTSVPAPRVVGTGVSVNDNVIDNDGLVEFDSAMGFRLGTSINEFFDHTRTDFVVDGKPLPGSWYRRYRSGLEGFNHDIQREEAGRYVWVNILSLNPGPLPSGQGELSVQP